ncbi:MAG: transposase [Candidatus Omnitrophica bacterium]|nr:transposase [Candidatus Omnitrophota bacterium]
MCYYLEVLPAYNLQRSNPRMPRKPRELVDNGIYHIFNRGNDRRNLFATDIDYRRFLQQLQAGLVHYGGALYHYCLMPNHFHFLLKIEKGNDLAAFMHQTQLGYARYFKKTRAYAGHVFQERFRSPRIAQESYHLQCGRYIERNPVEARLAIDASAYPYSSAPFYARGIANPLVTPNPYYSQMGDSDSKRQSQYHEFLALEEPYTSLINHQLSKA